MKKKIELWEVSCSICGEPLGYCEDMTTAEQDFYCEECMPINKDEDLQPSIHVS